MKKTVSLVAIAVALLYSSSPVVGSGKPPSSDVALRVTVEGNPNMPGLFSIVGDGRDYVDGEEGVYAVFQVDNGTNDFIMDPTNTRATAPRAFWFNFADKIADGNIANPWYGSGFTQIDTYLNFNEIYTVPVGTVGERSGGFGQLFAAGNKKTSYAVKFNPNNPGAVNFTLINTPNYTSAVEVNHPDCNTWILTPKSASYGDFGYGSGSGAVCALISAPNTSGQYLMPFQITLTRKTPINCT
jgi:hypothetical protein